MEVNNPVTVAVEGVNVAGADTKVSSKGENVGIGEGGERIAVLDEGIAGGGVGGGGGVLHFLVPLFVFVFALSLKDTMIITQDAIDVKGFRKKIAAFFACLLLPSASFCFLLY